MMSELIASPVTVDGPVGTFLEKEDDKYPAIHFRPDRFSDARGGRIAEVVDESLRSEASRRRLAELTGRRLGVGWARVVITFGASGD